MLLVRNFTLVFDSVINILFVQSACNIDITLNAHAEPEAALYCYLFSRNDLTDPVNSIFKPTQKILSSSRWPLTGIYYFYLLYCSGHDESARHKTEHISAYERSESMKKRKDEEAMFYAMSKCSVILYNTTNTISIGSVTSKGHTPSFNPLHYHDECDS